MSALPVVQPKCKQCIPMLQLGCFAAVQGSRFVTVQLGKLVDEIICSAFPCTTCGYIHPTLRVRKL